MRSRVAAETTMGAKGVQTVRARDRFGSGAIALGLGTATAGVLGLMATVGASSAAADGACPSNSSGVTVVVQFPTGVATSCAPGSPGTVLNAVRAAGFSTIGTAQYGDAFLCAVNSYPTAQICPRTPPANAYWAVFTANRGGSWAYSNLGVTLKEVPAGGVVGLRFGSGAAPSVAVPSVVSTSKPAPSSSSNKPAPKKSASPTSKAATSPSSSSPKGSSVSSRAAATQKSSSAKSTQQDPSATSDQPVVKATQEVSVGGKKQVKVVFSDGSSQTMAPSDAAKMKVGSTKPGGSTSASDPSPSSTSVAAPTSASKPSYSTSGTVPLPVTTAKHSGSNLPGVLAGAGALAVVGVGGVMAYRRRG